MRVYVQALFTALCLGCLANAIKRPCDLNGKTLEDQVQEAKGIHSLDICRLTTSHHVGTEAEKVARACTAALVLVDGHAMAVTAATCFWPRPPSTPEKTFQKSTVGQLYKGDVTLNCGPTYEKLEIKSTFEKPKVIVHPDFNMKSPNVIAKNNLAVIRIAAEDYTKIPEAARPNFLFTRISNDKKTEGPTADVSCRCYSPREAANTEPKELKASRCPLDQRIKNVAFTTDNTCFIVRKEHNEVEFDELKKNHEKCIGGFCGIQQTMACFCKSKGGPTVSSLRALHSVGFYSVPGEKGDKTEIIFLGVPIGPNWPFLLGAKPTDAAIGATDKQMEEAVPGKVDGVLRECIAAKKGDLRMKSVQHFICRTRDDKNAVKTDTTGIEWNHDELVQLHESIADCVAAHPELRLRGADNLPLPFPPVSEIMMMMMNGLDKQKLCPERVAKDPGFLKSARLEAECYGLLFVSHLRKGPFLNIGNVYTLSGGYVAREFWKGLNYCDGFITCGIVVWGSFVYALTGSIVALLATVWDAAVAPVVAPVTMGTSAVQTIANKIL